MGPEPEAEKDRLLENVSAACLRFFAVENAMPCNRLSHLLTQVQCHLEPRNIIRQCSLGHVIYASLIILFLFFSFPFFFPKYIPANSLWRGLKGFVKH